jgi:MFS transporter, DHA2 family, multidrug resistance protein
MAIWGVGVMVGPILGPTLGGWLTDSYDWRWVFFINLPIGALAFYGIWRFIPSANARRVMGFDTFGFTVLTIAIGALQMLLDRGEQNDWLSSTETWVELVLFVVAAAFLIAHTATTPRDQAFIDIRVFKDRNFATGVFFIFIVGAVLYATRALTPPMLQGLMGYPVATAGLVTAPSGVGTMISMFFVGKLVGKVDLRLLLLGGFGVTAFSLWQMTGYTLVLSEGDIVWPGLIQGVGLGLVFVPLSAASFSTLQPTMFASATATYSLIRNIGSSIGISLVQTMLVRNTQIAHASLAEHVTSGRLALQGIPGSAAYTPQTAAGLELLNGEVTRQAAMIAYVDDFVLMLALTLAVIPLLLLIRPAKRSEAGAVAVTHAVAD